MAKAYLAMGNEAIAEGAIAAGARFYAGYPITPSSEIAEISSRRLPQVGGIYVQMEDEISSMAAVLGASAAGVKSYTATSGPGISLMQENFGLGVNSEIPCVVINVQRSGPSTGLATKPGQMDVMQARWGTHGDHAVIALSPATVQQCYDYTVTAFNLAEKYRTPVYLLADEVVAHMRARLELHEPAEIINRRQPEPGTPGGDYPAYRYEPYDDMVAPMPAFGSPYILRMNGSTHDENGFLCGVPSKVSPIIKHYTAKIEHNANDIVITKSFGLDDADYAIISFGCSVLSGLAAMRKAREQGLKAGVLQLVTVWPFADEKVREVLSRVKGAVVPEMNLGQVLGEVRRNNVGNIPILGVNKVDSEMIIPSEVLTALEEVAR